MKHNNTLNNIKIVHSEIIRPRLELKPWGLLIVLPQNYDKNYAYKLIRKHEKWIRKKYILLTRAIELSRNIEIINRPFNEFKYTVRKLIEEYSKELGVKVNKIYIRNMSTKWASCSTKGNITVNKAARFLPDELLKYIVYHETCHLLERRHNMRFWSLIAKKFPNYREFELALLAYQIKLKHMNIAIK